MSWLKNTFFSIVAHDSNKFWVLFQLKWLFLLWIFSPGDFKWRRKQWRECKFWWKWRWRVWGWEHHPYCHTWLWRGDHTWNRLYRSSCNPTSQEGNNSSKMLNLISFLYWNLRLSWHQTHSVLYYFTFINSLKKQEQVQFPCLHVRKDLFPGKFSSHVITLTSYIIAED